MSSEGGLACGIWDKMEPIIQRTLCSHALDAWCMRCIERHGNRNRHERRQHWLRGALYEARSALDSAGANHGRRPSQMLENLWETRKRIHQHFDNRLPASVTEFWHTASTKLKDYIGRMDSGAIFDEVIDSDFHWLACTFLVRTDWSEIVVKRVAEIENRFAFDSIHYAYSSEPDEDGDKRSAPH